METILIGLKNERAKRMLDEMVAQDIIEVIDRKGNSISNNKISELKDKISVPMSDEAIEIQLQQIRNEWKRNI